MCRLAASGFFVWLLAGFTACGSLLTETARINDLANGKNTGNTASSDKVLTSLYFDQAVTGLSTTYNGTFSGNNITVRLPYGLGLTALKPGFSTTGKAVMVGAVQQVSGVTANNFSGTVVYTVVAADGTTQNYNVSIFQISGLQDTGQVACFGMGVPLGACNDNTFPNQDADFTNWPNARTVQTQTTNPGYPADDINRDPLNGIVWKTCAQGASGSSCATGSPGSQTQAAASSACLGLNSGAGYAGLQGWRLPTAIELMQLQQFLTGGVYFDPAVFPAAPGFNHWSSTVLTTGNGIQILGNYSAVSTGTANRVKCVSGGAYPAPSFVNQGDGTILDERTGLVWQKCAAGQTNDATCSGGPVTAVTWSQALIACKSLSLGGRTWRVPNMMEAFALVNPGAAAAPFIDSVRFPNFPPAGTPTPRMWTSTTLPSNSTYAYVIDYATVSSATIDAKNASLTGANRYYGRCVSGP